jgi:hypothetical protein
MDKKGWIILFVIGILVILTVSIVCIVEKKKDNPIEPSNIVETGDKIVSVITIDVNPSMELSLDKNNRVVSVRALNDDSKKLVENKMLEDLPIEEAINNIIVILRSNKYLKDSENTILVNVESSNENLSQIVNDAINKKANEDNITVSIIMQAVTDVTDEVKELAEKYNISISKAYYISEQAKNDTKLVIDNLAKATLNDIQKEIIKETTKEDTTKTDTKKNNSSSSSSSNTSSGKASAGQPSDPTKELDKWCSYNKNGNPYGHEKPLMKDSYTITSELTPKVMSENGITSYEEFIVNGSTITGEDSRSSYCVAYLVTYITRSMYKTYVVDSVKGTIIDVSTKSVPNFIDIMEARRIALNYESLTEDDVWDYAQGEIRLSLEGSGGSNPYYRYSVHLSLKAGGDRFVNINAVTGKVIS